LHPLLGLEHPLPALLRLVPLIITTDLATLSAAQCSGRSWPHLEDCHGSVLSIVQDPHYFHTMAVVHPNMQQEELAALFARNLTFTQPVPLPIPEPVQVPVEAPKEEAKIVYISAHYNHSAHVARHDAEPPVRPASEPPQPEHSAVERVLRDHGVDPSCLSSAQLQLFKTVDDPQRIRLMELWRQCPPTNSLDNPTLAWSMTSVSQEEMLAKMRYDQRQRAEQETIMSLDGTPLTPIQGGDGRWGSATSCYRFVPVPCGYMEPYMATGYEEMARRHVQPARHCHRFYEL